MMVVGAIIVVSIFDPKHSGLAAIRRKKSASCSASGKRKKNTLNARPHGHSRIISSDLSYVGRLKSLWTFDHIEFNFIPFLQGFEALTSDGGYSVTAE